MKRRLIDALLIVAGLIATGAAFALLSNAKSAEPEPVATDGPAFPSTDTVLAVTPMPTPEPSPVSTPEPTLDKHIYNPAVPLSEDLQIILRDECEKNGVDIAIAIAVIEVESGFDPNADNGLCYGLMQLNRRHFPDKLPPGENIVYGVEYLGQLLVQYDTVEAALTAYNAGRDTGSRVYANAVLAVAEKWREII